MKKIALPAVLLSCAGTALAQSSVTLFGVLDVAASYYSTKSTFYNNTTRLVAPLPSVMRSQTVLSSGNNSSGRFGLRGTEDLGGGLAASFWMEAALLNDTGAGQGPGGSLIFNRRSTVSLSGAFGEVRVGRDYTPTSWNDGIFSPFNTFGAGGSLFASMGINMAINKGPGSATSATDNYLRTGNGIAYFLPRGLGGFYGQVVYAFDENLRQPESPWTRSDKGRYVGGRFGYMSGDLDIALAYGESTAADTRMLGPGGVPTGGALKEKIKTLSLGASYNLETFKLFGELSRVLDDARTTTPIPGLGPITVRDEDKYDGALIGVTVPVGPGLIKAAFARVRYENGLASTAAARDASVRKLSLGYEYYLSKRTALYVNAAYIRIKGGQNNPAILGVTTGGAAGYLSTGGAGFGYAPSTARGYDIGFKHSF